MTTPVANISDNMDLVPNQKLLTQTTMSIIFSLLFLIGLVINCIVFYTYKVTPHLQTPTNTLIIGCVMCDIAMLLLGYPFVIASGYAGEWMFGDAWCQGYGFITTLMGITSVCILTSVALDRYYVILRKPVAARITVFKAKLTIIGCIVYSSVWAFAPLLGWGRFEVERSRISCGPAWGSQELSAFTYNVSIFIFTFFIPVIIVVLCYGNILHTVWRNRRSSRRHSINRRQRELTVALSVFLTISSFLCSWTPYATLSMWSMFNDVSHMSERIALFAPLMAKSSSVSNPFVYVAMNPDFRKALLETVFQTCYGRQEEESTNEVCASPRNRPTTTVEDTLVPKCSTV